MKRLEQRLNQPIVVLVVGVVAVALNVLLYFGLFLPRMTPLIAHINPIGTSLPEAISPQSGPEAGSNSHPEDSSKSGKSDSEANSKSGPVASSNSHPEDSSKSGPVANSNSDSESSSGSGSEGSLASETDSPPAGSPPGDSPSGSSPGRLPPLPTPPQQQY